MGFVNKSGIRRRPAGADGNVTDFIGYSSGKRNTRANSWRRIKGISAGPGRRITALLGALAHPSPGSEAGAMAVASQPFYGYRLARRVTGWVMGWTKKEVGIVFSLSLALLLLVWLVAEVGLALLRPAPVQRDALLGWKLKANYHREFVQKTLGATDYPVSFATNDQALRVFGSATAPLKILVLGDSFTVDPYASDDRMWYVAMVKSLASHLDRPESDFYVMGGGAGGWGTYQNLLLSQELAPRLKPDLFVLQFCSNDFQNNSYDWESKGVARGQFMRRPFFVTDPAHPGYAHGLLARIYRSVLGESRLLNRVDGMIGSMQVRRYGGYTQPLPLQVIAGYERDSIALTQTLLARLRGTYKAPAVMVNCDGREVGPNRHWKEIARKAGFIPLGAPSDFLRSVKPQARKDVFNADGSHLSEEGNGLYGAIAGDEIASLRLLPSR
jgi:lysophospholipase L1-like esterase